MSCASRSARQCSNESGTRVESRQVPQPASTQRPLSALDELHCARRPHKPQHARRLERRMSSGRVEPTGQRRHPPWCGAINETARVWCSYRMPGRLHSDRHTRHLDHRDGFALVRRPGGKRRALATRHRNRDGERSACARPAPLRLTRATERYGQIIAGCRASIAAPCARNPP